jgi:hypothetical protein
MGTQFKSSLSKADCRRINNEIREAKSVAIISAKDTDPTVKRVPDLPDNKKIELGDTTVSKVLGVIDSRGNGKL